MFMPDPNSGYSATDKLCEKQNGSKRELNNLKAVFKSKSQELHKKLNASMKSHGQEIDGLKKPQELN